MCSEKESSGALVDADLVEAMLVLSELDTVHSVEAK